MGKAKATAGEGDGGMVPPTAAELAEQAKVRFDSLAKAVRGSAKVLAERLEGSAATAESVAGLWEADGGSWRAALADGNVQALCRWLAGEVDRKVGQSALAEILWPTGSSEPHSKRGYIGSLAKLAGVIGADGWEVRDAKGNLVGGWLFDGKVGGKVVGWRKLPSAMADAGKSEAVLAAEQARAEVDNARRRLAKRAKATGGFSAADAAQLDNLLAKLAEAI